MPTNHCKLTMLGLNLLEKGYGIPILKELETNMKKLLRLLRIKPNTSLNDALKTWLACRVHRDIEPTWKNLSHILGIMSLDSLATKIEGTLFQHQLPVLDRENQFQKQVCHKHEQSTAKQLVQQSYHGAVFYQRRPTKISIYFVVICSQHCVSCVDMIVRLYFHSSILSLNYKSFLNNEELSYKFTFQ